MQIKINFLCRDSILAAPLVLDLALFADLAQRAGMYGVQDWLSFYLKSPQTQTGVPAENDIFKQLNTLKMVLRTIMQEEPIDIPVLESQQRNSAGFMTGIASIIATAGGIGFLRKGGGTAAAVAFCIVWYLFPMGYMYQALLLILLLACRCLERYADGSGMGT